MRPTQRRQVQLMHRVQQAKHARIETRPCPPEKTQDQEENTTQQLKDIGQLSADEYEEYLQELFTV